MIEHDGRFYTCVVGVRLEVTRAWWPCSVYIEQTFAPVTGINMAALHVFPTLDSGPLSVRVTIERRVAIDGVFVPQPPMQVSPLVHDRRTYQNTNIRIHEYLVTEPTHLLRANNLHKLKARSS